MAGRSASLAERLARLGMPLDGDALARAEDIVRRACEAPHLLPDLTLMTLAVEAYRRADRPVPAVV